jgi:quinol monooxygenase YgiN
MTVTVLALVKALKGKEAQVKENLSAQVAPTRLEHGCINYDLHQSGEDPCKFMFYENWSSREALKLHSESAHIRDSRERNKGLLEGPVEITLWEII